MLAIVRSLSNWRAELQGTPNKIKIFTDHKALEYFMTTKNLTARQARWSELLSQFFFYIAYRPGKKNVAADALTRQSQDLHIQKTTAEAFRRKPLLKQEQLDPKITQNLDICSFTLSEVTPITLIDRILQANKTDPSLESMRSLARDQTGSYTLNNNLLFFKGLLVVPNQNTLRTDLIREAHDPISSAHPSPAKTARMLRYHYFWQTLRSDCIRYVQNCTKCRQSHRPKGKTPGLLKPLPIPQYRWQHICVDFKSFPPDRSGYNCIVVFIDRLSKEAISIPCYKTITAKDLAEIFCQYVYRYHNVPESIVSDRGPQFISSFWKSFCTLIGTNLNLSTAYHPQTDGQTEIMNQYIDQRLRPYVNYYQDNWASMLPALDNAQLTIPHASLGISPYELSHGFPPRKSFDWKPLANPENAREKLTQDEATMLVNSLKNAYDLVKSNLEKGQEKNKKDANKKRTEPNFSVGDMVWLLADNLRTDRPSRKLDHQQRGPFRITSMKGSSYKLDIPSSWRIHPVFSANLLRKAATNPLPGQTCENPSPVNIVGDDEYEIVRIKNSKVKLNRLFYQAEWLDHIDNQWYPASDFMYAPHLVQRFHKNYPKAKGPPKNLAKWLKAFEDGTENYENLRNNEI
ncbi:hypothetical protein EPUL_006419, partial [Erysiphe pulchra]